MPRAHLVERRLGDVEVALLHQLRHLPVEEREQQRADVGAVDVGVGHDDDLVVAQLRQIEVVADAGAERGDDVDHLLGRQHLVEARALHVEDLAADRQHRLKLALAALLGRAAGRVALDDEHLGVGRIAVLALGELARQRVDVERALAPRQLARLARRLARERRLHDLADDDLGFLGVLLEPGRELIADDALDHRLHLRGDELVLRLAGELRVGHLDRQHAVRPSRASSPERSTFSFLASPLSPAYLLMTRVSAARKPARCVPPSRCGMLLVKQQHVLVVGCRSTTAPPRRRCRPCSPRSMIGVVDQRLLGAVDDSARTRRCRRRSIISSRFLSAWRVVRQHDLGRPN